MHQYVKELEEAIRTDEGLRSILSTNPGTAGDVGAGLVLAVVRRAEGPITIAPSVRIDPDKPSKRYREAAHELAQLVYDENDDLLHLIETSTGIIGHRPRCRTSPATVLLGYIAANEARRESSERKETFGDEPSPEAQLLAQRVHDHPAVTRFHVSASSTTYQPEEPNAEPYAFRQIDFAR